MNILMISFDKTLASNGPAKFGNTLKRHISYTAALRHQYPDSQIVILVRVPPGQAQKPILVAPGLTIYPLPCRRPLFFYTARKLAVHIIRDHAINLITTQTPFDDGLLGLWLKHRYKLALNVQMRSSFLDQPYWIREHPFIYRLFNILGIYVAKHADTIRVVCQGEKQRLEQRFLQLRKKIFALHPLIDLATFTTPLSQTERQQILATLHQAHLADMPFLVYVGRVVEQKNLPTLFRALALLKQKNQSIALVIPGDGPLRPALTQLAKQLSITDRVLWLGSQPLSSLRGWFALARCLVMPSFHEGFGKTIVESYCLGTPAILAPFVSAAELVQHEATGFITKNYTDYKELATYISRLLVDPNLAKRFGEQGKDFLLNHYLLKPDDYSQQLLKIWEQTLIVCAV